MTAEARIPAAAMTCGIVLAAPEEVHIEAVGDRGTGSDLDEGRVDAATRHRSTRTTALPRSP